jgi:hypothetical protein
MDEDYKVYIGCDHPHILSLLSQINYESVGVKVVVNLRNVLYFSFLVKKTLLSFLFVSSYDLTKPELVMN